MIHYQSESITVFQSHLQQTTSTVVATNDLVLVADPCWLPGEVEEIRRYVATIRGERPLYLLFTHADWDHIIGYRAFPEATVIASHAVHTYPETERQRKLDAIRNFDGNYYLERPYPIEFPAVDVVIEHDGQQVSAGSTTLTFYHAHGHERSGLFTVVEPLGVFLAGDYLSDAEFPFIYYSSTEYDRTLQKVEHILQTHAVRLLVPGHGSTTESVDEIRRRTDESQAYIAQVRECVQQDNQPELAAMINRWKFAPQLRRFHQDNIDLITRELQK
ncbi:MBL fold metallo-hydrolase [Tumebacillus flagellatus]|uniref:Hydrolase glyoxylase n=1 Tax=Tumebacillus flagellatus TaxID=1157490 RepID=A0A074LL94_9BACL|nr:MBL fold metallo-hydrolase [Tumebacillus flagellatus]KEO81884.1 hydrolase glyoxylase [Tumebacillus flagellatus]